MAKLERPALGRHVQLGMLYDSRTDNLMFGQTLWDPLVLQTDRIVGPYSESQSRVILTDSFKDKSAALDVDDALKASILCGLVECGGAAAFLNHRKQTTSQARVALHCKLLSRYEQMTFRYAGEHNIQPVCAQRSATHVVTGILYGAHSFFVFDRPYLHDDKGKHVQDTLHSFIEKISSILTEGKPSLNLSPEEEREVAKIQCTVFSDIDITKNPAGFKDAVQVYTEIPFILGKSGENAVPVRIWLHPLGDMKVPAHPLETVSSVVNKSETFLDGLEEILVACDDLTSLEVCDDFPPFAEKLNTFQKLVHHYKSSFQDKLKEIMPRIRDGKLPVKEWTDLLVANERSPFQLGGLTKWVKEKEKEMSVVKSYRKIFFSCPIMRTRNQLDELILDPGIRYVVCFSFPLLGHEDACLKVMNDYLDIPQDGNMTCMAWCDDVVLCKNMRINAKQFSNYALANSDRPDAVFVMSGYDDGEKKSTEPGCIFLYERGQLKSKAFEPSGAPEDIVADEISQDAASLKWTHSEYGQSEKQYYLVKYRETNKETQQEGNAWEELKTDKGQTQIRIVGLWPSTSYECEVSAVCKIGTSCPSDLISFKTLQAHPPGPVKMCKATQKSITVSWAEPPVCGSLKILAYKVVFINIAERHNAEPGVLMTEDGRNCMITITGLQPCAVYRIWVTAVFSVGKQSVNSEAVEISTLPANRYAENLAKRSHVLKPGNPSEGEPAICKIALERKLYTPGYQTFELGRHYRKGKKHSVIMLVGATGAGKSTLINGMINFITGVEWNNKFRFQLTEDEVERKSQSQAHSQTQMITSYTIHYNKEFNTDYTMTIIDTPGFGDTRGIERDREIVEQIKLFFDNVDKHHIDHIDAIGFVAQASQARLTYTQRYIFDSVLSIFGKDIKQNIMLLVTFADGQKPPLIDAIREADIPCTDRSFKFNNSALYRMEKIPVRGQSCDGEHPINVHAEDNIDHMFWKMGTISMRQFFADLGNLEAKSLTLTRDVLEERHRLEITIQGLQPQIHVGYCKLDQLQMEQRCLVQYESQIQANKDFEYEIEVPKVRQIDITGKYITNCSKCHYTCHYPCTRKNDEDKINCAVMKDGFCRVCPGKCAWDVHFNMKYKFEYYTEWERKKYANLEERYKDATGKKLTVEQVIVQLQQEFIDVQESVLDLITDSNEILTRLEEIALKPNPLSTVEYIDLMIESEKREAKPYWERRVNCLEEIRIQADILRNLQKTDYDPFEGRYGEAESLKKTRATRSSTLATPQRSSKDNKLTKLRKLLPF